MIHMVYVQFSQIFKGKYNCILFLKLEGAPYLGPLLSRRGQRPILGILGHNYCFEAEWSQFVWLSAELAAGELAISVGVKHFHVSLRAAQLGPGSAPYSLA